MNDTAQSRLPEVQASFGSRVLRVVLDQMRTLPDVWQKIPEAQQQGLIDLARDQVDKAVREGISVVTAFGFPHAEVGVESIAAKAAGKVVLTVADPHAMHELLDAIGRKCVLVLVDPEMFVGGMEAFKADADQPQLPLGESDDEEDLHQ